MADQASLHEDFASVTNGGTLTTSNTIYDAFTGGGTSVGDTANKYAGLNSALFTVASAQRNARLDFTAAAIDAGWFGFGFRYEGAFSVNCGIAAFYAAGNTTHAADIRINTDDTLRIRNAASSEYGGWSYGLTVGQWYYVNVRTQPSNWGIKVYNNGSLVSSALTGMTTAFNVTGVDTIRMGPQTTSTGSIRFARLRGDSSTEPTTGIVAGNPSLGTVTEANETRYTIVGSNGTLSLTQDSGPTAVITGPTGGVFTVEWPSPFTTPIVMTLKADDNGTITTQTKTINPPGSSKTVYVWDGNNWI